MNHLNNVDGVKFRWLPCAYNITSIDGLVEINKSSIKQLYDLICIYRYFPKHESLNNRNIVAYETLKIMGEKKNIKYCYCNVPYGVDYISALRSSRIVLNISMSGDLNIRNFECIGFNRTMLADKVADHDSIGLDYKNTYFFNSNLFDFRASLDRALEDKSQVKPTFGNIINCHTLMHRYVSIINNEIGLNITLNVDSINTTNMYDAAEVYCNNINAYSKTSMLLRIIRICIINKNHTETVAYIEQPKEHLLYIKSDELNLGELNDYNLLYTAIENNEPIPSILSGILMIEKFIKSNASFIPTAASRSFSERTFAIPI